MSEVRPELQARGDFPVFAVVEDAPSRLVLANRGPRIMGAIGTLVVMLVLAFAPLQWDTTSEDMTARAVPYFFGAMIAFGILGVLDRQQFIFEPGHVRFTSRLQPWKRFDQSTTEIEKVEVTTNKTTFYGEDSVDYSLHLAFRDGTRVLVNKGASAEFHRALAERIEEFRR